MPATETADKDSKVFGVLYPTPGTLESLTP